MSEAVMAGMKRAPTGDRAKYRPDTKYRQDTSDFTFIVWAAIIAIGLILLSVALGVEIDPDVSMFASP